MKLLQRYILGELIRVFALLVVVLTVMLVFVGVLSEATEQGLGPEQILQILPYVVPSMLPFTIPATLLLAVTVVYGRLAGDLEVTAAKAAGVNPLSLLTPAFQLGFVLAIASFGLTNYAIPWAIGNIERIVTQAMEDIFLDVLSAQHYISQPEKGYSITVEDVHNRILVNPTFRYRNGDHEQVTMKARWARIQFDLENRKVRVQLKDALGIVPGRDTGLRLDRKEIAFDMDVQNSAKKARHLTIDDIENKISDLQTDRVSSKIQRDQEAAMLLVTGDFAQFSGDRLERFAKRDSVASRTQRKYKAEVYGRYAMASSCLVFAFLGGPFAILQAQRQFITSFIMCFLPVLIVYYPLVFLMAGLAKNGTLDPAIGMWVPNLVIAAGAILVLRRVIRH